MTELEKAEKALWDYIDSLPAEKREKAIKFQAELELEASRAPGGWLEVIPKRLSHLWLCLADTLHEMNEQKT